MRRLAGNILNPLPIPMFPINEDIPSSSMKRRPLLHYTTLVEIHVWVRYPPITSLVQSCSVHLSSLFVTMRSWMQVAVKHSQGYSVQVFVLY